MHSTILGLWDIKVLKTQHVITSQSSTTKILFLYFGFGNSRPEITIQFFEEVQFLKSEKKFKKKYQAMQILNAIEKILINSGLGTDPTVRIAGQNVPRSLIRFSIFSFPMLCGVLESILCIRNYTVSLTACFWSFSIILSFVSAGMIYARLVIKAGQINDLFNFMEDVINTSNVTICSDK